jgi:hypothetical protein
LSSFAAGGLALKFFWNRSAAGLVLAAVLVAIGAMAYGAGRREGRSTSERLRLLSLATTAAALLAAIIG